MTQRQAFLKAIPKSREWKNETVDSKASIMFAQEKVRARFYELQSTVREELTQKTIITQQEALETLTEVIKSGLALEGKQKRVEKVDVDEAGNPIRVTETTTSAKPNDIMKAIELAAKILGWSEESQDDYEVVTIENDIGGS